MLRAQKMVAHNGEKASALAVASTRVSLTPFAADFRVADDALGIGSPRRRNAVPVCPLTYRIARIR